MYGRMSLAPSAQLMPMANGFACRTDTQKASMVWPDSVRPLRSVIVTEISTGISMPFSSNTSRMATSAALAFSVSTMVSTRITSAPPSTRPRACSLKASRSASKVIERSAGLFTSGEIDSTLLVGPIAPATKRGLSGVFAVHAAATRFAMRAPSTFIS